MHSLLKNEYETADMVEKLALMQRQYVEWGNDSVEVRRKGICESVSGASEVSVWRAVKLQS